MPSNWKKNKRRLRRVQAQRRALEEQHAANPPVKAGAGITACAPPATTPKKAAKTPALAPTAIPEPVPVAVPIVEIPKVEPIPVVKEPIVEPVPVEVQAPETEPEPQPKAEPKPEPEPEPERVLLEQTPAEVEVELPAPVTEAAPLAETPPVEPPTVDAPVVQVAEPIVLETEPVTEVIPPVEVPVVAPPETEILTVDTTIITTETELTNDVCKTETEVEAEALPEEDTLTEVEVEVVVTEDVAIPEPVTEATEEPVVEALSRDQVCDKAEPAADEVVTETVVESVVEVITEISEPEPVTEVAVSPAAPTEEREDEGEVEVLAEEDAPEEVSAESVTITEDVPVQSVEIPEVPDIIPEALVEEAKAPITETKGATVDRLVDDFVVTESDSVAVQQEIEVLSDTLSAQTESTDVTLAEPEPAAAPAEEMVINATAEQTCLDKLSGEPKSEICDMPCQMQLAVESVQLSSVEMSVEPALNGHCVPEVSIEG